MKLITHCCTECGHQPPSDPDDEPGKRLCQVCAVGLIKRETEAEYLLRHAYYALLPLIPQAKGEFKLNDAITSTNDIRKYFLAKGEAL